MCHGEGFIVQTGVDETVQESDGGAPSLRSRVAVLVESHAQPLPAMP
jgi:hypothetical protein